MARSDLALGWAIPRRDGCRASQDSQSHELPGDVSGYPIPTHVFGSLPFISNKSSKYHRAEYFQMKREFLRLKTKYFTWRYQCSLAWFLFQADNTYSCVCAVRSGGREGIPSPGGPEELLVNC